MCLGIPMQILHADEWVASCTTRDGTRRQVSLALVGPQDSGTWLLVHKDTAREILTEDDAHKIHLALQGVAAALRGESGLSRYFGDLETTVPHTPES